jgi:hypothetical protein
VVAVTVGLAVFVGGVEGGVVDFDVCPRVGSPVVGTAGVVPGSPVILMSLPVPVRVRAPIVTSTPALIPAAASLSLRCRDFTSDHSISFSDRSS